MSLTATSSPERVAVRDLPVKFRRPCFFCRSFDIRITPTGIILLLSTHGNASNKLVVYRRWLRTAEYWDVGTEPSIVGRPLTTAQTGRDDSDASDAQSRLACSQTFPVLCSPKLADRLCSNQLPGAEHVYPACLWRALLGPCMTHPCTPYLASADYDRARHSDQLSEGLARHVPA